MRKSLVNFLKGIAIMVSTMVPGVSGGTMAIVLGIYDDLIHAVGSFFENWKKHSILLIELGLGAGVGILLFGRGVEYALNNFPVEMGFLFMGVICGGIPVLFKKAKSSSSRLNLYDFLFLLVGFVIVMLMANPPEETTSMASAGGITSFIFLFIAGIIAAVALILPGISGSFMLLVLGLYNVTINAINTMNIPFLMPLGLGVLVGTLATTKGIEKLLQKFPKQTYMMILGFVAGSIIPVFPGLPTGLQFLTCIPVFLLGFLLLLWLSKKEC